MLDERKASILRAVVEEYIQSAQPVGSSHVVGSAGVAVSSATVRNDMASLEIDGYLQQPHTSAGRIPTEKGYRWFVDALAEPSLDRAATQQVRTFFNRAHGEIEQMLADTTRLLSGLTDYAAMVVGPAHESGIVRSIQVVGLAPHVALVVAVLGNGVIEKRTLELGEECDEVRLAAVAAHLTHHLVGSMLHPLPVVPPTRDHAVDQVVAAALGLLAIHEDADNDHVFVGGASRMAASFDAVESVRSVLAILEQQLVVVSLLRDVLDRGLTVAIGTETGMQPLADCSIVVAPFEVEGEPAGTIGVLGPTRMNYPQALAAVAVVSNRLSRRLSEG